MRGDQIVAVNDEPCVNSQVATRLIVQAGAEVSLLVRRAPPPTADAASTPRPTPAHEPTPEAPEPRLRASSGRESEGSEEEDGWLRT